MTVGGTLGQARLESHDLVTYSGTMKVTPSDTFAFSLERRSTFAAISPRTVALGLSRLIHRGQVEWAPAIRYVVAADASHEKLSDGNERWEVFVAPRAAVARTEHLNLDLGFLAHRFGATHDLQNGYYDPREYEYYSVVIAPYWKISDNVGINVSAGLGGQRDDSSTAFRFGGNASAEATFGIYERWLLKLHGSTTANRRLESGAFRGLQQRTRAAAALLTNSDGTTKKEQLMRALITGGAGFIGSHLAETLIVTGSSGHGDRRPVDGPARERRASHETPGFRCVIDSVMNEMVLLPLVEQCDVVFHLAAAVGVKLVVEAPIHTIHTNVHGTETVLKAAGTVR